ncbi:beta-1,3-glucan-binding protein-like isoform X1 [Bicyclus anynana]|uniref:Beta-1,3-glucan-binding protein-like isoform X1 n=1 Tax=Bicyclus anynana TaxID=110368 RepID=A0ABM3LRW9_BICAN|nr:beta-1,3-glucan-binding protein-like isoform X1 [Bicyclus anynana]
MASRACTRVILILAWIKLLTAQYSIPSVTIQALKPKGIRVSIPDTPGLSLFVFQGNVNRSIAKNDVGNIMGEITEPTDGRWVFEDLDVQLNVGDVINYYVHVVHNQMGYIKDPDSVIVRDTEQGAYHFVAGVHYRATEAFSNACLPQYKDLLAQYYNILNERLSKRCSAINVNTNVTFIKAMLSLLDETEVKVDFVLEITPARNETLLYDLCGTTLKLIFDLSVPYASALIEPILNVSSIGNQCPSLRAIRSSISRGFIWNIGEALIRDTNDVPTRQLEDPSSKNPTANDCGTTQTRVRNGKACAGNIIFEERFDFLREDVWQIEQYIPDEPDFPFVSYQRPFNAPTVSVQGGNLRIEPKLQQNVPGFGSSIEMGTLDLFSGCTSTSTKCRAEAWGASILPPIVSGRLTTKAFAFTYGLVEIRAKLPQGDWLYPDILLESFLKKYGSLNYASGVVRVGGARGNEQLAVGSTGFGNNLLYGGVLMDATCRDTLLRNKTSSRPWGDDFHVYSVRWTPDVITLSVDGEEWARFAASGDSLKDQFPPSCDVARSALTTGSKLAPFDDHFVITLGIAAGGITEFPDDATSGGKPKPWKNTSRKASLRFWQDIASWIETWRQPALIVDYVTVRAL